MSYTNTLSTDTNAAFSRSHRIDERIRRINTCIPGVITAYNTEDGSVNCRPTIKKFAGLETFDIVEFERVPVVYSSGGGYSLTFPLTEGDPCLILFSQVDLDNWSTFLEDMAPNSPRQFDLSDSICLPGLYSPARSLNNTTNEYVQLNNSDDSVRIRLNDNGMEVYKDGDELFDILQSTNEDINKVFQIQTVLNEIINRAFDTSLDPALSAASPLVNAQNVIMIESIISFLQKRDQLLNMSINT